MGLSNMEKIKEVIAHWRSTNSTNKYSKLSRYHAKLAKKLNENEYVRIRDSVVIGLYFINNGIDYIPNVKTNENGRADLYKLKNEIFELFENVEEKEQVDKETK